MIRIRLYMAGLILFLIVSCSRQTTQTGTRFWGHRFSQAHDVRYGERQDQIMDIYSQGTWVGEPQYWQGDRIKHPTLVYIHGGGWLSNTKDQIIPFVLPYLERGFNVLTIEYGKGAGTAPLAVDDCMRALQWINRHADENNIDRSKIIISGESAGGHLAMITGMLSTIPASHPCYCGDSLKVAAIVNWFGIGDIAGIDRFYSNRGEPNNYAAIWVGSKDKMDFITNTYSPIHRITSSTPPLISVHGRKDTVVPFAQAEELHKMLKTAGVRNELVSFADGTHLGFSDDEFNQAYSRIFSFLGY